MDLLTVASFLFFTGLVAFLTWRLSRSGGATNSEGYFLAGRALTGGYIAGSLMLTNLSTEQLVGLNGAAYKDGLAVMAWEVVAAMSLVAMALFFLPRYLRSGIATIPEFLESRFDGATRTITSIIFVLAYAGILLPMILYTGAKALVEIFDLSTLTGVESQATLIWCAVLFIGIVGSAYAIFGGLRSVAISDTLNGFGLLVGGIMITWMGLDLVAGSDGGVLTGLQKLHDAHPEKFRSLGDADSSVPFDTLFTGVLLLNLFYWTTNQQIIQRTFGASSLATGQKGVLLAGALKILAPLILVLPGIIAFHLYGEMKPDDAYGTLVRDVLPDWLVGFFGAVVVGAILSTFNSALNSTATLVSLGIVARRYPTMNDRRIIASGKIVGGFVAIVAMILAPLLQGQDSIFGYLQKMNALYFIPIFAVVVTGLLDRRVPAFAANLALILGLLTIGGVYLAELEGFKLGIHGFHFLGAVFAGLVILMVILRFLRPRPEPWTAATSSAVDLTPWRLAWPTGIALVAIVLTLYVLFADTSVL